MSRKNGSDRLITGSGDEYSLRFKLMAAFPALQNITLNDLDDMKWSLKQQIFSNLFGSSVLLEEFSNELHLLLETKDLQYGIWRRSREVSREEKMEYERNFRTKFMHAILKGLVQVKWPPALQAFSDPIDDLLHDRNTCLDAIHYLLAVTQPKFLLDPPPSSSQQQPTFETHTSNNTRPLSSSSSSAKPMKNSPDKKSTPSTPSIIHRSDQVQQISLSSSSQARPTTPTVEVEAPPLLTRLHTDNFLNSSSSSAKVRSLPDVNPHQLIEFLLYQNEQLSSQLRVIKEAIRKREQVEVTIGSLISDLGKCLEEIVEVGVIGGKQSLVSSTNEEPGNNGVCRYCSLSITTSQPPPPTASSSASITSTNKPPIPTSNRREAYSWRATQTKLKQLEKQWIESTRAARQAANNTPVNVNNHRPSSSSVLFGNPRGNSGSVTSQVSSSSSSKRNGSMTMADKARNWVSTMTTGHHQQPASTPSFADHDGDVNSGVDAISTAELKRELAIFSSSLHQLEEQLHSTTSWTNTLEYLRQVKKNTMKLTLLLSSQVHTTMSLPTQEEDRGPAVLKLINLVTQDMLPKLKRSSSSSLPSSSSQVSAATELQSTIDNAFSEHITLCRSMSLQRQAHKQWTILLQQLSEKLAVFGRAGKKALDESLQKIAVLSYVLKDIDRVFCRAEDARISQRINSLQSSYSGNNVSLHSGSIKNSKDGGNNKDVMINPLDALCRGVAGEEVAALIEALRMHVPSMSLLDTELSEMSVVFLKAVQWEQRGLQDFMRQSLGVSRSAETSSVVSKSGRGAGNNDNNDSSMLLTARSEKSNLMNGSSSIIGDEKQVAPVARVRQGGVQGKVVRSASSTNRSSRAKVGGAGL